MVLTKWTNEMTSKFISLYREQECLWRNDSLIYRNRDARDTALKNVIVGVNLQDLTIDDVKKKIKYLRSTYMIEVKKIERSVRSGAGTSTIYKPSLAWFAEMDAFIKYVNVTRETKSSSIQQCNIENPESGEQTVSDTNKDKASGSAESDQQVRVNVNREQQGSQKRSADVQDNSADVTPKNPDSNRPSQTARNKRTRLSQLSAAVKNMREISADLNKKEDTNKFEVYGKYVGVELHCMDEGDAILAQQEIQSILTKYKLKKVQRNRTPSSDYQSLVSPSDGRGSVDSNSQSYRPFSSYGHDYTFEDNETDMADVEDLSAAGLQYSDVQCNVDVHDDDDDTANDTNMTVPNVDIINSAFRNA